jgi:acetoin utilization deacetylase AcuC-like enzyme
MYFPPSLLISSQRTTYEAALYSAYCALTGADLLLDGAPVAYALCRPPGHHAAADLYGGALSACYCVYEQIQVNVPGEVQVNGQGQGKPWLQL